MGSREKSYRKMRESLKLLLQDLSQRGGKEEEMSDWKKRLEEARATSKMEVVRTPLYQLGGGWEFLGRLCFMREDGGFFKLLGMMVHGAGREVPGWGQPMVVEAGSGVYVLVTDEACSRFLVFMRQEPGNPRDKGFVLLGPSLQVSKSNFETTHRGKKPPRLEAYNDKRMVWVDAPKDGGRFVTHKTNCNRLGVLVLPSEEFDAMVPTGDELVLTRDELKEALTGSECNAYLRESAGVAILLAS